MWAYGAWLYVKDEKRKFKKRLEKAFDRAGIFIKKKSGNNISYERPKLISMTKSKHGWNAKYLLPVGITIDDIEKAKRIIEGATSSEINAWTEGQTLTIEIYNHHIPHKKNYQDVNLKPLSILMGYGRKGIEILDYTKLPNPHMLIAGMSGMGKSNVLNVIAVQLLKQGHTLFIADPKRVEFTDYAGITTIAKDNLEIYQMLQDVVNIQQQRERFLEQEGYKNIHTYNAEHEEKLDYIFVLLDEYADFPSEDELFWDRVITISRKGRASGIYLIMSTQRPSADVLPPSVKSNLGIKVALKTSTLSNSRIILDSDRAYKLPMIEGRAILDTGIQREIQIPYLSDKQLRTILQRVRNHDEGSPETL